MTRSIGQDASGARATTVSPAFADSPLLLIGERGQRLYPLNPVDIDYIESAGNYVKYMCGGAEYIARDAIKQLQGLLQPFGFIRIERSLLLNVWAIDHVEPVGHGTFAFTLQSGASILSGPTYRTTILKVLPLRRRSARRALDERVDGQAPVTQMPQNGARVAGGTVALSEGPLPSRRRALHSSQFLHRKAGDR